MRLELSDKGNSQDSKNFNVVSIHGAILANVFAFRDGDSVSFTIKFLHTGYDSSSLAELVQVLKELPNYFRE